MEVNICFTKVIYILDRINMNYIKDNNMFTIVYINKETIEVKQDYLYELEDKTTVYDQLRNEYLIENLYRSLEALTTKQKRRVISYYFNNESIEEIALKEKVSESAIRKSIHQSLIQLKRKLNKYK